MAAADGDVIGTQAKPDPVIQVTAVILAGGMARRMGGLDKGLIELAGRPMVAHIHRAIAPQVRAVVINANRNLDAYAALGTAVVPDALTGFQGPLAGMASGLRAAHTDWILTLPCDSPFVPPDMADRMCAALLEQAAELAVASDGQRLQPVFALLSRSLLPSLARSTAGSPATEWRPSPSPTIPTPSSTSTHQSSAPRWRPNSAPRSREPVRLRRSQRGT